MMVMDQMITRRPTGITITAWLWIVMGVLMALSGLMGVFAYSMMQQMGSPPMPSDAPAGYVPMNKMFQYFGALLVAQTVAAILAVSAGIALLYLKAWARTTLEILSWLAFLYCVGFGIFWVYTWISMTGHAPTGETPFDTSTFQIMGAVMGLVVILVFAAPLWIMIRYLRGNEVRTAISSAKSARV
jgi:TRAP-type C4-dicarboxylate transport system permease small subunit